MPFPHGRGRARPLGGALLLALGLALAAALAAARARGWWTTEPDGGPVWLADSALTDNDHGFLAARTIDLLAARGARVGAELAQYRDHFLYGAWSEDYVTGGTAFDHLYAAGHHWDGGNGAPAFAQGWFDAAVSARRLGQRALAYEALGRAAHYVQDMTHAFHAVSPAEPEYSGVLCLHQPWYGIDDARSHCHSVVELRVARGAYAVAPTAVPRLAGAKEPGRAAAAWARAAHGKNEREIRAAVRAWHDAVRRGDWAAVDRLVPDHFGRAVAAVAGLAEAFAARAGL